MIIPEKSHLSPVLGVIWPNKLQNKVILKKKSFTCIIRLYASATSSKKAEKLHVLFLTTPKKPYLGSFVVPYGPKILKQNFSKDSFKLIY